MAVPPHPPPVMLLAPPLDDNVPIPADPRSPPSVDDVIEAIRYYQDVDMSISTILMLDVASLTIIMLLSINTALLHKLAAATGPQANDIGQVWNDIRQDMMTIILPELRQSWGRGHVVPLEVAPFVNGDDPTLPPHNLPPLHSVDDIDNLNEHDLVIYLTLYGTAPLPGGTNPTAARKQALKVLVGASN
ncbi:hypothetical protein H4582DRAFT_2074261 [Lactarius indigo]|nr:hypothetical protein H4582DRAFT_2074261 [Lactarius indigo]